MIDLFSSKFEFFQGKKRNGRTTLYGKMLSLLIILISLSFFSVLLIKLFENDMLPKIVKITDLDENESNKMVFDVSPISFSVFINKKQIEDLETLKPLFFFSAVQAKGLRGASTDKALSIQNCQQLYENESHLYYNNEMCLDNKEGEMKIEKPTHFSVDFSEYLFAETQILLYVQKCIGVTKEGIQCKTLEEIEDFLANNVVVIHFRNRLQEFNSKNKELQITPKYESILLGQQTVYMKQRMIKSSLVLDDGFLLANETNQDYISNYETQTQYVQNFRFQNFAAAIEISLQKETTKVFVEYPKITEILPQVQSVFSTLCVLGVLVKFLSEALIFQDLIQNYLDNYYQKANQNINYNSNNNSNNNNEKNQNQNKMEINSFKSLWWYFKLIYFGNLNKKIKKQNNSFNVYESHQSSTKSSQKNQRNLKESDVYEEISDSVKEKIEVTNIFKELMELKTCMHFLLSEEQYAAIKKCGRNLPDQKLVNLQYNNNNQKKQQGKSDKFYELLEYKRLNHIEKMDLIDKNEELQSQLYEKFKFRIFEKYAYGRSLDSFHSINSEELHNSVESEVDFEGNNGNSSYVNYLILDCLVESFARKKISKRMKQDLKSNKDQNQQNLIENLIAYDTKINTSQRLRNQQAFSLQEYESQGEEEEEGGGEVELEQQISITDNVGSQMDCQRKQVKEFFERKCSLIEIEMQTNRNLKTEQNN